MKRLERLRWRLATLLDKMPGQCWADIADWPLGHKRNPWSPQRPGCRQDMERLGGCYCGKLRKPDDAPAVQTGCAYCTQWNREPHDPWCPRSTR